MATAEELIEQAKLLPPDERRRVVDELLRSLDKGDEQHRAEVSASAEPTSWTPTTRPSEARPVKPKFLSVVDLLELHAL